MTGDPANASAWAEADVYTAPEGSTVPTDVVTAWDAAWSALGLLDGESGFSQSRDQDVTDTFAWGGILVRSIRSKQKRTFKIIALEQNDTVFSVVNPGSPAPAIAPGPPELTTRQVYTPNPDKRMFGMELREGANILRRWFTGEVTEVGDITEAEGKVVAYELTIVVYPGATGLLYTELEGPTS